MGNEGLIALKVINGMHISAKERRQLTPSLLVQLAGDGLLVLTLEERSTIEPDLLSTLIGSGRIKLTRGECDRMADGLAVQHLVDRQTTLDPGEIQNDSGYSSFKETRNVLAHGGKSFAELG